jgi:hypothetical protein
VLKRREDVMRGRREKTLVGVRNKQKKKWTSLWSVYIGYAFKEDRSITFFIRQNYPFCDLPVFHTCRPP